MDQTTSQANAAAAELIVDPRCRRAMRCAPPGLARAFAKACSQYGARDASVWALVSRPGRTPTWNRGSQNVLLRRRVWLALRERWEELGLRCQPSYTEIARMFGMSHSTIVTAIQQQRARVGSFQYDSR